jgi:hypothetical protein
MNLKIVSEFSRGSASRAGRHSRAGAAFFGAAAFAFAHSAISFARNFAMRFDQLHRVGLGERKGIVPLLTSYGARTSFNAATT